MIQFKRAMNFGHRHSLARSDLHAVTSERVDKYCEMFATPFYSFFMRLLFFLL